VGVSAVPWVVDSGIGAVMLLFEWNSLRVGDSVIVHDDDDLRAPLMAGRIVIVQPRPAGDGNDLSIRLSERAGGVVRPRRGAVHSTGGETRDCWRCHSVSAHAAAVVRSRLGIPDRVAS
jgi:hypothetical protein